MPRYLTKIELLDAKEGEPKHLIKALVARNTDELRGIIIPTLPELEDRKFKVLGDNIRQLEEEEFITTRHGLVGYAS